RRRRKDITEEERKITDRETANLRTLRRAVKLLAAKPRSVGELRERLLEKKWTDAEIVDDVIARLTGYGYLNDAQFAKDFAALKLREKPFGKRR
ncbi:RecX family transcriptional regulator, partial [Escherichia coli]|nr:RecX family transcriptional regulator [Escherichia coli]